MTHSLFKYCCRIGDNALVLSHRLGEYSSHGPFLEEDLAITNVALDLIGQCESILKYAGEVEGQGRTEDDLAYKRPEREFLNCQLVEMPNTDFAYIMVRQFFMDVYHLYLYGALMNSKDDTLKAIAGKSIKEVKYHVRRSHDWMIRLGNGTEESRTRLQKAIDDLWVYTGELFESDAVEQELMAQGIAPDPREVQEKWNELVNRTLTEAKMTIPDNTYMATGGRQGIHTEHMGYLIAQMQFLPTSYPDAKW